MKKSVGKVYLVGAGPGDPGLMTVKGWRLLTEADVIIYDHLVNDRMLDDIREKTPLINVGKQVGKKILEQGDINKLLIREAMKGQKVVRLKGGDPFIFGRGGEEAQALAAKGIPFEVVTGITSAIAAPAYAGIPLTHRGAASSVAIVTGHEDPAKKVMAVNFKKIAQSVDTIVCLMGVGKMESIVDQIQKGRKSPETPAAIVERGTYAHQRVVEGTLKDILAKARKAGVKPPAVIVVGEVAQLRTTIGWFESLPLAGKTVVVTRAREQAGPFIDSLEQAGARVIPFPTIEIGVPRGLKAIDGALGSIKDYDYIVFTSVNGVKAFISHLHRLQMDVRSLGGSTIAALGEMTAQVLREHLLFPKIVPTTFTSKHLAREFKGEELTGKRVLLFRSQIAHDLLPRQLRRMGADVREVSGYTIRKPRVSTAQVKQLFKKGEIDLITFTSPSTFTNFVSLMGEKSAQQLLKNTRVAAIGPVTKNEIVQHGIRVAVTASSHTVPQLVEDIIAYYRSKKR